MTSRISKRAEAAIVRARQDGDGLAISAVTLLELAMLSSKGRIQLRVGLESFMATSRRAFWFCRLLAASAFKLLICPRIIQKIQWIESLEQLAWWKAFRWSPPTAQFEMRGCCLLFGEGSPSPSSTGARQNQIPATLGMSVDATLSLSSRICLNQIKRNPPGRSHFYNRGRHSLSHSSGSR